ncbi:hypothetical protein B0O99DRAFT_589590 [Bisporella sp. PMI_857]|nr:hypothetical protein B0O99DRAFT_589590 [Bisporella sp. PMI_857]
MFESCGKSLREEVMCRQNCSKKEIEAFALRMLSLRSKWVVWVTPRAFFLLFLPNQNIQDETPVAGDGNDLRVAGIDFSTDPQIRLRHIRNFVAGSSEEGYNVRKNFGPKIQTPFGGGSAGEFGQQRDYKGLPDWRIFGDLGRDEPRGLSNGRGRVVAIIIIREVCP